MSAVTTTIKSAFVALSASLCIPVMAQAVKTANEPYIPTPSKQTAEIDLPIADAAKAEVIKVPALLTLMPGKSVEVQLKDFVESTGWSLAWDAGEFSVGQKVTLTAELNKAVTELVEAANAGGTRIKATFYRGNKFVRISEY